MKDEQLKTALNSALQLGYRHIDTAYVYGNEKAIGDVLKEWISQGKLKREDLFITTKLPGQGVHPDLVEQFMKQSLEALQVDYVDLYLIHFPFFRKIDEETGNMLSIEADLVAVWKVST